MLIRAVKENIAAANGFLDSAKFGFADGSVSLTVPDGAQLLIDAKTPEFLERFISETFDKRVKVSIDSGKTAVTIDSPEYVEMQSKNVNIEIPKEAPPERKKPKQEYDDLPISLTNAKVIFGSRIKSKPVALKGVSIEDGNVTVWGSVFALQIRDTRDGKRKIITFNITDKTNSFTVKIFETSQNCETLVKNISDGACVMLRGHVEYDDYIKSYCIKANSVMLIAVAITDHGVVQAFPEAAAAAKGSDIKIIYGMEGYFVDDSVKAFSGSSDMPIDGTFIIFDVETTGLRTGVDRLTEIGAVKYVDGAEKSRFQTFVDPERPIPQNIVELTGITDSMVAGAPKEGEAVRKFFEFCGEGSVIVAHNASFDTEVIRSVCERNGIEYNYSHIDTLVLAQSLISGIKNYKLDTISNHFKLPKFDHHRADEDAGALAAIFEKLLALTAEKGVERVSQINELIPVDPRRLPTYHIIILAKNKVGLKHLYQLITKSNLEYYYRHPRVPKSELLSHREGLLIGSACEAGQLYRAVLSGKSEEELLRIASMYDYLEIQGHSFLRGGA